MLSVLPLDTFVDDFAGRMEIVGDPDRDPARAGRGAGRDRPAEGRPRPMISIERFAFYERREDSLCGDPDRRAAVLRLLHLPQGRDSAGRLSEDDGPRRHPRRLRRRHRLSRRPPAADGRDDPRAAPSRSGPGGKGSNQAVAAAPRGGRDALHHPPRRATPSPTWRWRPGRAPGVIPAVTEHRRRLYRGRLHLHRGTRPATTRSSSAPASRATSRSPISRRGPT